jgi:outer membrane lipoprotein-sorting protein
MPRSRARSFASAILVSLINAAAAAMAAETPSTVDQLVAKNLEARGGAAAIAAMQTLRLSGKMLVNDGQFELRFLQTLKRPASVRNEATLQGLTQVQAWDGKQGWQIDPFQGRKDAERLSEDDVKSLAETVADFDGPLINWQAKGHKLDYLGTEDIDGTPAHKLRLTRQNGDIEYVWLDPEFFLEIRLLSQRTERGVKVETEIDLSDYEKVSGVMLPMAIDAGSKGSNSKQKLIFKQAEVNAKVDDALFAFPAAAAKGAP